MTLCRSLLPKRSLRTPSAPSKRKKNSGNCLPVGHGLIQKSFWLKILRPYESPAAPGSSEKMMIVSRASISAAKLAATAMVVAAICVAPILRAQVNPSSDSIFSSAANAFYGSVTVQPVTDEELKLTLDDAVRRGLDTNLGLKQSEYSEKNLRGQYNQAVQQFLPTISLVGDAGYHMYNLAALGFGPSLVARVLPILPPGTDISGFSFITRAEVTEGQLKYEQTLFSGPVIAGYKAAGAGMRAAYFAKMSARGEVVQQVASAYLRAIAAASAVENARALEEADRVAYNNAHDAHVAGTAANPDDPPPRAQSPMGT